MTQSATQNELLQQIHDLQNLLKDDQLRQRCRELAETVSNSRPSEDNVLNSLQDGIITVNRDLKILSVNKAFLKQFEVSADDAIGRHCFEVIHGLEQRCDKDDDSCCVLSVFKTAEPFWAELPCTHPNGVNRTLEMSVYPIVNDKGEVEAVTQVIRDVTHWQHEKSAFINAAGFLKEEIQHRSQELVVSEQRYRNLLQNLDDIVFALDLDGKLSFVSHQIEALGYQSRQIIGRRFVDFAMPKDHRRVENFFKETLQERRERPITFRIQTPRRGNRWIEVRAHCFRTESGEAIGFSGVARDITDRKWAEDVIRESEQRYRSLFESASDAIMILRDDMFIDCNQRTLELFHCTREDIIGQHPCDLSPDVQPDGRPSQEVALSYIKKALKGESQYFQWHHLDFEGNVLETDVSLNLVELDGGEYIQAIIHDTSERKRAEQAMADVRALLTEAINQSPAGILIANAPEANIRIANTAALAIRGGSWENLTEIPAEMHAERWQFCSPSGEQLHWQETPLVQAVKFGEVVTNAEIIIKRDDGEERIVSMNAAPVHNQKDEIIAGVAVFLDITDLKRIQKETEMRKEQLIHADKMASLGTLVAGVAHEINNPNNFVMLNAPILKDAWEGILPILDEYYKDNGDFSMGGLNYTVLREKIVPLLDGIDEGASRIRAIVEDLRSYARSTESTVFELIDLNRVVTSAIKLMRGQLKKVTDNFEQSLADSLPLLPGNYQRLEQVLINLLQNSCHSLPSSGCAIRVSTTFDRENGRVLLIVEDEGRGIPEENMTQITDPFFTTKRDSGGTGLGLSVSAGIINDHHGTMHFESKPGKGTKVTIALPCMLEETEETNNG